MKNSSPKDGLNKNKNNDDNYNDKENDNVRKDGSDSEPLCYTIRSF